MKPSPTRLTIRSCMGTVMALPFSKTTLPEMQQQIADAAAKPGEDVLLSFASDTEAFYGRLAASRDLSKRAIGSALHDDSPETAAAWQMDVALRDAEFNNVALSRQETATALATASTRDVSILAALALARIGDTAKAKRMADDLAARFPLNTVINRYWLPTIYASIEIDRGNPARAVELLQTTPDVRTRLAPSSIRGRRLALSRICPWPGLLVVASGQGGGRRVSKVSGSLRRCGELPAGGAGTTSTRSLRYADGRYEKRKGEIPRIFPPLEKLRS